jgi:hypothetical protein
MGGIGGTVILGDYIDYCQAGDDEGGALIVHSHGVVDRIDPWRCVY